MQASASRFNAAHRDGRLGVPARVSHASVQRGNQFR